MPDLAGQQADLPRSRWSPHLAVTLLASAAIVGIGEYVFTVRLFGDWTRFANDVIWFAVAALLARALRGWWRDILGWVAALMLCIAGAEAYAHYRLSGRLIAVAEPSFTVRDSILGWRLGAAGRYRHFKLNRSTGQKIFDVDYTIAADGTRQVLSAADGPTVGFFGDSLTFGEGLPDAETLPQAFADQTGRRLRVLDLGVLGYGPQQFLRALESGIYDELLRKPRVLIYETGAWQAELASCAADYVMAAPRYRLVHDSPVLSGRCGDNWSWLIGRLFTQPMYSAYVAPILGHPTPAKIELYLAILTRAAAVAREKFDAPTVLLYLPNADYLAGVGITDDEIMERLRASGLIVVDGSLDAGAFPGQLLSIPGEGHPTGVANRARASLVLRALTDLGALPH